MNLLNKLRTAIGFNITKEEIESSKILSGNILSTLNRSREISSLYDAEFRVFSQFGDDGIIQYLISKLDIKNKFFIEFGVEDFSESNCRFLMMNNNWSGFVIDGSQSNIEKLKKSYYYWKYDLSSHSSFITKDNINELLSPYSNIGLLHIDLDGNDYWILKEIDLKKLNPDILILEYNSLWGNDLELTIPYDPHFYRTDYHFSNLYWGASLPALTKAAKKKGYFFVGVNSAGNNAYYVKEDQSQRFAHINGEFKFSTYREARTPEGHLTFLKDRNEKLHQLKDLTLINLSNGNKGNIKNIFFK